nr:formin-like protein 16 [Aegilops tauschii subsp. strangulata]
MSRVATCSTPRWPASSRGYATPPFAVALSVSTPLGLASLLHGVGSGAVCPVAAPAARLRRPASSLSLRCGPQPPSRAARAVVPGRPPAPTAPALPLPARPCPRPSRSAPLYPRAREPIAEPGRAQPPPLDAHRLRSPAPTTHALPSRAQPSPRPSRSFCRSALVRANPSLRLAALDLPRSARAGSARHGRLLAPRAPATAAVAGCYCSRGPTGSDDFANDDFFPDLGNLIVDDMGENVNAGGASPAEPYVILSFLFEIVS